MQSAYLWCTEESGKHQEVLYISSKHRLTHLGSGSFARMKAHMNDHIATCRLTMFQESALEVQHQLEQLLKEVENELADKTDEVFVQMKRDYRSVSGGGNVPQNGEVLPREARQVRKETRRTIEGVEKIMRRVAGLEVEMDSSQENEDQEDGNSSRRVTSDNEEDAAHHEFGSSQTGVKREASPSSQLVMSEGDGVSPTDPPKNTINTIGNDVQDRLVATDTKRATKEESKLATGAEAPKSPHTETEESEFEATDEENTDSASDSD